MPIATAIALITATLNLATALGHLAISRAPGWKSSRVFAAIAITAAFYSLGNVVFTQHGFSSSAYEGAIRWNYIIANLHLLVWFPFAYGSDQVSLEGLPRGPRLLGYAALAIGVVFLVTGWHTTGSIDEIFIPWADVTYHYVRTTPLGDLYSVFLLGLMLVPFAQFVRRMRAGEPGMRWVVLGFLVFMATGVVEALVASRVIVTLSPADLGFLAVTIPTSVLLVNRFVAEAGRLREVTGQLEGDVRDRTEERDRAQTALVDSERLTALGQLAAGVGHEINNPLTYLQLSLAQIAQHLGPLGAPAQVWESLGDAQDGAHRIQRVAEGLRSYSRLKAELVPLDPIEVARAALKVANPHLRHVARVESDLQSAPAVMGDESRLVQALVNLLVNASQAVESQAGAGRLVLRTGVTFAGEAFFEVEDNGPGIPEDHLGRIAEPYFTTRGKHGGLGLGLFVTHGIVESHHGVLGFDTGAGRGTRARITLPALESAPVAPTLSEVAAAPVLRKPSAARGAGRPSVLLVDDEPLVLQLLSRVLEPEWEVVTAPDGAEALGLLGQRSFDVIVCDLMMPGITGMDMADRIERRFSGMRSRMLFLTGGAVTLAAQEFVARPDVRHFNKPVDIAVLKAALAEVCAAHQG